MRLLNTRTGRLEWFDDDNIPAYAILSHVWDKPREQTFQDVKKLGQTHHSPDPSLSHCLPLGLSAKLRDACKFAAALGYLWIWVDTCCINKEIREELWTAISSMFEWYSNADVCIAYLADVPDNAPNLTERGSALWKSRWFARGWTLQELIAPRKVLFVSQGWKPLGTRVGLAEVLEAITGVNKEALTLARSLSTFSIAERMRWAAYRETTRVEDRAYSVLGIFEVSMYTLYGEGMRAFRRLQEELLRSSPDQTLFAWEFPPSDPADRPLGLFADTPSRFSNEGLEDVTVLTIAEIPIAAKAFRSALDFSLARSPDGSNMTTLIYPEEPPSLPYGTPTYFLTNHGMCARMPLLRRNKGNNPYSVAILAARHKYGYVGLVLRLLFQADIAHYAPGMHRFRLVLVGAHPNNELTPDDWAKELDLIHDDVTIRWEDICIATAEPWRAHVTPFVEDMPLGLLSRIPVADLTYFRSQHHHSFISRRCLSLTNDSLGQDLCGIGDSSLRNAEALASQSNAIREAVPKQAVKSSQEAFTEGLLCEKACEYIKFTTSASDESELAIMLNRRTHNFTWIFIKMMICTVVLGCMELYARQGNVRRTGDRHFVRCTRQVLLRMRREPVAPAHWLSAPHPAP